MQPGPKSPSIKRGALRTRRAAGVRTQSPTAAGRGAAPRQHPLLGQCAARCVHPPQSKRCSLESRKRSSPARIRSHPQVLSSSELLPACSAPRRTPRSGSGQGGPRRCRPRGRPRRAPTRGNGGQPQGQRAPRAGRRHDGPGGQSRVPSAPRCPLSSGRAARSLRARSFPGRTHRGPRAERAARSGGGRKGRRRS